MNHQLVAYLHYRIVDVSSIFEVVRRWFPKQLWKWSQQQQAIQASNQGVLHRAHSDIQFSLRRTYLLAFLVVSRMV